MATLVPSGWDLLQEGLRCERSGVLDRARAIYESAAGSRDAAIASEALRRLSSVQRTLCAWDDAVALARRSAEVARLARRDDLVAEALNAEAAVYQSRGDFDAATPLLERILTVTADDRVRGIALQNLGSIAAERGDLETAERRFVESRDCFQRAGYQWGVAVALNNIGCAALDGGNIARAEAALAEALSAAQATEDHDLLALARLNRAKALSAQGRVTDAEELASSALGYYVTARNTWRRVECLRVLGDINVQLGNRATARRCLEQGLRLAREIGARNEVERLAHALEALDPG